MFSQTFVDGTHQTRKPITVLASTLLQIGAIGVGVLVPLLYTQRLPSAALRSMLTAPPPPIAAPKRPVVRVTPRTNAVTRSFAASAIVAPTLVPRHIAPTDDGSAAPDIGGLNGPAADSDNAVNALLFASTGSAPQPPLPAASEKRKAEAPLRVGGVVAEANVIHRVQPLYPALARSARVQGTVEFTAVISKAGRVEKLMLLHGHPLLVNAARDAILQWQYRPTRLNGEPVEVLTNITVNFTLSGG